MRSWGFHTNTYMCTHPHEPVQTTHVQEKMRGEEEEQKEEEEDDEEGRKVRTKQMIRAIFTP